MVAAELTLLGQLDSCIPFLMLIRAQASGYVCWRLLEAFEFQFLGHLPSFRPWGWGAGEENKLCLSGGGGPELQLLNATDFMCRCPSPTMQ